MTRYNGDQIIIVLGALLLFCDAPFLEPNSGWQILRAGRKSWFETCYTLWLFPFLHHMLKYDSGTACVSECRVGNRMGKVISTLAQTNAAYTFDQEPLDYLILSRFSPQEAMGLTMLAIWCLSVMTGVVSYAGNFLVHRGFGIVINCGIALTALLLSKFSNITIGYYCAPPLWMNIASYKWQGMKRAVDGICLQCLCDCHRRMHDPLVSRDSEKGSELCGGNLKEWKKR